jgi:Holliday junction resolvase RusA-like endonuclease
MGKQRPRVTRRGTFTPAPTRIAEQTIREVWLAAGAPRLPDGPHVLRVDAYFPRPESHLRRDGTLSAAGLRAVPGGRIDVDNVAKLVMDSLSGCAWNDDRFIVRLHSAKHFADKSTASGLRISANLVATKSEPR